MVRMLLCAILVAAAACGGSTPTTPDSPAPAMVQLGPQILQLYQNPTTPCGIPAGAGATLIVTRVTLSWSGSEWVARTTSAAVGDVELHLRPAGSITSTRIPVSGTISGSAVHVPELLFGATPYTARITFGATSVVSLSGAATPENRPEPAKIEGTGNGSATVTDGAGIACSGTSFSWTLVRSDA
jgi:hypothetical protein